MYKKGLALAVCLLIIFTFLPMVALATGTTVDYTLYLFKGKGYKDSSHTDEVSLSALNITGTQNPSGNGYTYTFDGIDFTTTATTAIQIDGSSTTLVLKNANKFTGGSNESGSAYGLICNNSMLVTGSGSLTVTSGSALGYCGCSYGIYVNSDCTVTSGSITGNGGTAGDESYGIYVNELTVESGDVIGNSSTCYSSYGIYVKGGCTINGGNIAATSSTGSYGYGIYVNGGCTINGGSITATSSTDSYSYGIYVNGNCTINGGNITATSSTGFYSYGIYVDGSCEINGGNIVATDITTSRDVGMHVSNSNKNISQKVYWKTCRYGIYARSDCTINGGDVTAIGGAAVCSYGIRVDGNCIINGNVTAVGSDATLSSYGIYVDGSSCKINGGIVSGKSGIAAGIAGNESYGIYVSSQCIITGGTVTMTGNTNATNRAPKTQDTASMNIMTITANTNANSSGAKNVAGWVGDGNDNVTNYKYLKFWDGKTCTVSISAIPVAGGTISGGGTYTTGENVIVIATPSDGYIFVNWTENNSVISKSAVYSFTVMTDRTLVAVFQAVASRPTTVPTGDHIAPAQNSIGNAGGDIRLIGINIPSEDTLITTATQNGALLKLLGGNKLVGMWNISLKSGRTAIFGSTLSFYVGRENAGKIFTLYHQKADGTVEKFSATADGQGIVSFYPINELSPFMLVQGGGIVTTSIVSVPATGGMGVGLGLLLLSAIMAAAVMKRRKEQA